MLPPPGPREMPWRREGGALHARPMGATEAELDGQDHRVEVTGDIGLWARDSGDRSGTPVLLVMGAASSGVVWPDALVQRLGRRHRVIVWDHRDTGRSSRAMDQAPYELKDLAADAIRVLDHVGVDRAHVVGMSMGGLLAQLLMLDHGDRLLSATLLCTGALPGAPGGDAMPGPDDDLLALWARLGERREEDAEMTFRVQHWQLLAGDATPFPEDEILVLERRVIAHGGPADASSATAHARAGTAGLDRGAELHSVSIPTLVIDAPEDPAYPPPNAAHLAGTVPDAQLVRVPGMGHALPSAILENLANTLEQHLNGVDAIPSTR